jgi:hypothetical protein
MAVPDRGTGAPAAARRRLAPVGALSLAVLGLITVWWRPESAPALTSGTLASDAATPLHHAIPPGTNIAELGPTLPPGVRHGLALRLQNYPAVALATPRERLAAERLRRELWATASRFRDPRAAKTAGFDVRRPERAPGERRVMWFHSENRKWHADEYLLDARRPDTLIYADAPGRPLVLVGVMISMPRGVSGPTPGGPITRWHSHIVCVSGQKRGLSPPAGGCPARATLLQGSEMMHVWFTKDLRSAYAVHAPVPQLCSARLIERQYCSGRTVRGM